MSSDEEKTTLTKADVAVVKVADHGTEPVRPKRDLWSKDVEFLLASIGYCVGVGNIWRFPYLCYKNGGGAFLIPYFVLLITGAVPMYFLEIGMGQYTRSGCIKIWDICPIFRGVGIATNIMSLLTNVYFIILMVWPTHFMIASVWSMFNGGVLPWSRCDGWWNTPNCKDVDHWVTNGHNQSGSFNDFKAVESTNEYWKNRVLGLSDGIENPGGFQWELVGCHLFCWIFVYFCVWKGVKSSGKVVYFTATFPYVMLIALAARGLTLPGAMEGMAYYLTPQFSRLSDTQVWLDAGTQVFYSFAISFGCQMALGSYNKYNRDFMRDCTLICTVNSASSLLGGVVIFSVLGYMAHEAGVTIDQVAESGPGLAFVVYPKAVSLMPLAPLWSFAFFFMLVLVGIDSQFVGVEGTVVALTDVFPNVGRFKQSRELFTLAVCLISGLTGLSMVTKGGMYVFNLFDSCAATGPVLLWLCFWECLAFGWGYGADKIYDHIEDMVGRRIFPWLKICWKYITPSVIVTLFIKTVWNHQFLKFGDSYEYPLWAHFVGLALALSSSVFVPLYFFYSLIVAPGTKVNEKYANAKTSVLEYYDARKSLPPDTTLPI